MIYSKRLFSDGVADIEGTNTTHILYNSHVWLVESALYICSRVGWFLSMILLAHAIQ